ncbi:MAG: adenylate kinase [Rhodobacteraceae bacterium]|nr:adenylate kinase [Paracoccaceae bacterium]
MNIILLGPPGAGKGTQAAHLARHRSMVHLSTGDMLRQARASRTETGRKVAEVMDRGDLVTDEIVIGLIGERFDGETGGGFILDGFPRTLAQADALEALLERKGRKLDAVIELQVDDTALVNRIVSRAALAAAAGRPVRADDNEQSLRVRLMEYYKKTSPLIGYYYARGKLRAIDGLASIEEVKNHIDAALATV